MGQICWNPTAREARFGGSGWIECNAIDRFD